MLFRSVTETELTPAVPNLAKLSKELTDDPRKVDDVALRDGSPESAVIPRDPPLGGERFDADSSEPTLDKNIRFLLRQKVLEARAEPAAASAPHGELADPDEAAIVAARPKRGTLLLLAMVVVLLTVAVVYRFG